MLDLPIPAPEVVEAEQAIFENLDMIPIILSGPERYQVRTWAYRSFLPVS
jgi:hypothetical protein